MSRPRRLPSVAGLRRRRGAPKDLTRTFAWASAYVERLHRLLDKLGAGDAARIIASEVHTDEMLGVLDGVSRAVRPLLLIRRYSRRMNSRRSKMQPPSRPIGAATRPLAPVAGWPRHS